MQPDRNHKLELSASQHDELGASLKRRLEDSMRSDLMHFFVIRFRDYTLIVVLADACSK